MQQTTKYQFNLIETSDTFSPDPLNQNMEKVESALDAVRAEAAASVSAEAAGRAAGDAALDQRVQVLEARKIVAGYAAEEGVVHLGFTPVLVMAYLGGVLNFVMANQPPSGVQIVEGGFSHKGSFSKCYYLAIL